MLQTNNFMLFDFNQVMMNHSIKSTFYNNVDENDGETDNYVTCPLLKLKYSRPRKQITR